MTKHTLGSWRALPPNEHDESEIVGPDVEQIGEPENIASVAGGLPGSVANAHLIAPELLAFAQRVAATSTMFASEQELTRAWLDMRSAAEMLITKATGDNDG